MPLLPDPDEPELLDEPEPLEEPDPLLEEPLDDDPDEDEPLEDIEPEDEVPDDDVGVPEEPEDMESLVPLLDGVWVVPEVLLVKAPVV